MENKVTDDKKNSFDSKILSSSHINFFFGSGVNGKAFPQMNGFVKTVEKMEKYLERNIESFENDLEQLSDKKKNTVINILYDETGQTTAHKNVLEVFEKIVKEGRKFGCFLMLSSQRPSDISQTIISQLHNYFIHKLVNPSDIQKIRKAVAYLDDSALDFLTVLAPGECIVSGTAFQMPTFLYVNQVINKYRPKSENVKLFGKKWVI